MSQKVWQSGHKDYVRHEDVITRESLGETTAHLVEVPEEICVPRRRNRVYGAVVKAYVSAWRIGFPVHQKHAIGKSESKNEEKQEVPVCCLGHFHAFLIRLLAFIELWSERVKV